MPRFKSNSGRSTARQSQEGGRILVLSLVLLWVQPNPVSSQAESHTDGSPYQVDFNHPPRVFQRTNALGWEIWLEKELPERHPQLNSQSMERLHEKLGDLLKILPPASHDLLQARKIFLMLGEHSSLGGKNNGADYFQPTAPKYFPKLDPRMASSILIYSATNYVWLSNLWARKVLMHEMAHAWQLEQWPEKHPDILSAFHHAQQNHLYRLVRREDGHLLESAYALTNQLEYFAELSCIYFVGCDYFPHNRDQLRIYDPVGYQMIERMWGLVP